MKSKKDMKLGKFISLVLRHKPETIGLKLDSEGFVNVNDFIKGMNKKGIDLTIEDLDKIVKEDNKQRYNNSRDKIRANQGHSIPVNLNLKPVVPPSKLYHGTGEKYLNSILKQGIELKKSICQKTLKLRVKWVVGMVK